MVGYTGHSQPHAAYFEAVQNIQNALLQTAVLRRPSIKALKRTGSCFHPSRVG